MISLRLLRQWYRNFSLVCLTVVGVVLVKQNFQTGNVVRMDRSRSTTTPIGESKSVDDPDRLSNPLENSCRYPVLMPDDESLQQITKHIRHLLCRPVQPELLTFDYDRSELRFDRNLTDRLFPGGVRCDYRPFAGGIRPRITEIVPIGDWRSINLTSTITKIDDDLFEVRCLPAGNVNRSKDAKRKIGPDAGEIFRFAFGQIGAKTRFVPREKLRKNDQNTLSLDMLVLDSTSLNMMRRHMPRSWRYMKDTMGFFHLEGYTKVGDNSMVNLMPILTGLRFGDQAPDMLSDLPTNRQLKAETTDFLWSEFRKKNCATMFNDDIAHYTRGFLNYPQAQVRGFEEYPTDHFIRPWHIFHRRFGNTNSSKFCFGNYPYARLQLNFLEQMVKRYNDVCHFSFNFITDLSHDDPNNLETLDDDLYEMLERLYTGGHLNNTALLILGDHGNRVGYIMYTYVGRIEERMSLFSVYFPEWFRKQHPALMRQLAINRHRLTSNYDVHQMLQDILRGRFSAEHDPVDPKVKGRSLFRAISPDRTCAQANVPPQHCVCLETVNELNDTHPLTLRAQELILNVSQQQLLDHSELCRKVDNVQLLNVTVMTTSQMIQHGVRDQSPDQMRKLSKRLDGDIEYLDVVFRLRPIDLIGRTRLQYYKKKSKNLVVNIPLFQLSSLGQSDRVVGASGLAENNRDIPWFCLPVKQ